MFEQGQEVIVTFMDGKEEKGVVAFEKMKAIEKPPYSKTVSVSVILDSKRYQSGYIGTMFLVNRVRSI